jgi:hypothetical protein
MALDPPAARILVEVGARAGRFVHRIEIDARLRVRRPRLPLSVHLPCGERQRDGKRDRHSTQNSCAHLIPLVLSYQFSATSYQLSALGSRLSALS